ncbi:MazG nucleotide pyrophosphohydrolase domain-containing protein [Loigolactobacillus iwatensis]|uniref:MazG nucleotide pyrophosphohydrolase domain-containing protein n=1 Tax=Loigolactobacillus iwatensis TaxID=1267156 RepID=UPI000F7F8487|nr:MazG-like family protein [Loigolactobacillus iwatensis]
MTLQEHQQWLVAFYKQRNWYQYSPFIRLNFLIEEVGELSWAIRALEIGRDHPGEKPGTDASKRANLQEELADILDQVLIISAKYNIAPENLLTASETKLSQRFKNS